MIRPFRLALPWTGLGLMLALQPLATAASPAAEGWEQLWHNRNGEARRLFRAALKQNPSDPAALRGLGLLDDQEDAGDAALKAWLPLCRLAPAHWATLAYWPRMVDLAQETGRTALLEAAAKALLAAAATPPELRASARLALADTASRSGHAAEAEKQRAALAYLTRWRVIGPFDNVSLSGFDKPYPPERELDLKQTCAGKEDQPLRWHPLALVSRLGRCEVGVGLGDGGADVFYAATALFSPREQTVLLRWDPTGASKLFVNGRPVLADELYRQSEPLVADPLAASVTLHKGWNTLLAKLADDEQLSASFALRVTAPGSAEPLALTVDPDHAATAPVSGDSTPVEPTLVSWARRHAPPDDPEAAAAVAFSLARARDFQGAAERLKAAIRRAPGCGWLHWELAQVLAADEQGDEARAEREQARQLNPRIVAVELAGLEEEGRGMTASQRLGRLKALRRSFPESAAVQWSLAEAFSDAELASEAVKSALAAAALASGQEATLRGYHFLLVHERKAEANALLTRALRSQPDAVPLLQAQGRSLTGADAARLYQRLLRLDPANPSYYQQLAGLYRASHDRKRTIQALQQAREARPQDADLCAQLADALRESGRTRESLELYRTAVRLAPARVALREKLQVLSGERPVIDLAAPTPAGPILSKLPKGITGASAVILLDEARQVVYPDYANVLRAHLIIQVLDAAGAERYQEFPLAAAPDAAVIETARILKSDGKVQDVSHLSDGSSVAFPSLAPGDVIDLAYRVDSYPRGGMARQFWSQWRFTDYAVPVRLSRYVLIAPPGMAIQTQAHGDVPGPSVKELKGWRVREWRVADLPVRKSEPSAPGPNETTLWLDLSTLSSWRPIVEWYRDLSRPRCVPDVVVRTRAVELTRDAKTPEEKLRALSAFVAREIQYQSTPFRNSAFVPTQGRQVLRERYGDCKDKAALLTAMLAAVGIQSRMVLLSGRTQGLTPYLPSPRFNHAIARVELPSGPVWVDATADQMELGGLPSEDQGVPALVIDDATTDLVLTPSLSEDRNRLEDTCRATLRPDGGLSGNMELSASGDLAWLLRTLLRKVPESGREQMLRGMATAIAENATYESGAIERLEDPDQPLLLRFRYHIDMYSTTAGSFLLARVPWGQTKMGDVERLLSGAERQQDLETSMLRGQYRSSVRLELPAGYTPQELQPEVRGETPWGSYRVSYRMEGNTLVADSDVRIKPLRVPARDFPGYAEFLRAVDRETRRQIVLKKG
jgi:tetratricopeptide (TPR) repeat protein